MRYDLFIIHDQSDVQSFYLLTPEQSTAAWEDDDPIKYISDMEASTAEDAEEFINADNWADLCAALTTNNWKVEEVWTCQTY